MNLEPNQISLMEVFAKIVNSFQSFAIFKTKFTIDVRLGIDTPLTMVKPRSSRPKML